MSSLRSSCRRENTLFNASLFESNILTLCPWYASSPVNCIMKTWWHTACTFYLHIFLLQYMHIFLVLKIFWNKENFTLSLKTIIKERKAILVISLSNPILIRKRNELIHICFTYDTHYTNWKCNSFLWYIYSHTDFKILNTNTNCIML